MLVTSLTLNLLPTHVAFAYALGLLVLFKCVDEKGALQGFSNKGANTVAILYIVAFSVTRTNGMNAVFRLLLGDKPLSLPMVLLRLCIPLGGLSMFLNNTRAGPGGACGRHFRAQPRLLRDVKLTAALAFAAIYQAALPEVMRYAHQQNIAPSKLLIPVAFAIIFGGTMSLIGTSTNLVVSGLAEADAKLLHNGKRMEFNIFGLTKIGALYFGVGVTYIIAFSSRLLPDRKKVSVTDNLREYLVQLEVTAKAKTVIGKTIAEAGLRTLQGLFLVDITRGEEVLVAPEPDTRLQAGDVLTFSGEVDSVKLLFQKDGGLLPVVLGAEDTSRFRSRLANSLYEAVVSPDSVALVGRTVREASFRTTFGAAVVAISHRSGPVAATKLGDVVLQPGDTLVLEADKRFYSRFSLDKNFALVYPIKGSGAPIDDRFHLVFSLLVISAMISVAAADQYEIWITAIGSAIVLTASGCISVQDATSAIEIPIMLTICFAFGVGNAIAQTKLADAFAQLLIRWLKPVGPIGILFAIYICVSLLTEIITNNGACAVMYPIIASIVKSKAVPGLDAYGAIYVLMLSGSSSILTPIGYQLNLMAHAAGGYQWQDWVKYSAALKVLLCITACVGSYYFY